MTNKPSARFAAFISLNRCEHDNKYSNLEIDSFIRKSGLDGAERGLFTTLVYGVIERKITLDYIISKLSSKPVGELDPEILTLVRLGLYQLIYLDRIPESAAVNESVELAKSVNPRAATYVNAVLRGFTRTYTKDRLPYPGKSDRGNYLSVRYSCGIDVLRTLETSCADVESLLAVCELQPEVTLRVNTLKLSRGEMLERLAKSGVKAVPTELSPFGIKLCGHAINEKIPELISSGYVYIQDEASQLAVMAADPKPGTTVIDACACPGGKSFSAAILMENRGRVLSFDLHKNKLSLIEVGAQRLGISIIETAEKNGAVTDESLVGCADLVLCDAPCSGLGVIAKKPELRYKQLADIARLPDVQYPILDNCANYVKPGGRLFYTTCTLNRNENQAVAEKFLANHPELEPCGFDVGVKSERGMLTLLPQIHNTDGFFISGFVKKEI